MNAQSNNEPILNYTSQGEGPAVILLHGLATSHRDWEMLNRDLLEKGFHTLAVDMFGHGDSPKPNMPKLYNFKVVYGTLEEWIDSLEIERPFFMVGHSMGGYMSLAYLLRHPQDVRALTLIDPLYSLKQLPPFMINTHRLSVIGSEMLKRVPDKLVEIALGWGPTMEYTSTPEIRERIVDDVTRASPYILKIASTLPELSDELHKIETPCQVLWGDEDGLLNPDSFPKMVSAMRSAIGHVLAGRGHQPHIADPERVNKLVIEFLEMHVAPPEEILEPVFIVGEIVKEIKRRSRVEMREELISRAEELIDALFDWQETAPQPTLEQIEDIVLTTRQQVGLQMATLLLEEREAAAAESTPRCPNCDQPMIYTDRRDQNVETRLGAIEIKIGRYLCPACGKEAPLGLEN